MQNAIELQDAIPQEHPLGCAVACVAYRRGVSYEDAHSLFVTPENAWGRGYYCAEVVAALNKKSRLEYVFSKADVLKKSELKKILLTEGTLVFVGSCSRYPLGHYLVRATEKAKHRAQWMNPWINAPRMIPVQSGFESKLPGPVEYVMWEPVL